MVAGGQPRYNNPIGAFNEAYAFKMRILGKLRGQDLNLRPSGYEPDELPGCSTPRYQRKPLFGLSRPA